MTRQTFATGLTQAWTRRGAIACFLWPLSALHGVLVSIRRRLYSRGWLKSTRLPVPVWVVGNVIAGGAGKTPLVIALLRHLQSKGYRPGVVSRGYGRLGTDCIEVTPNASAAQAGDEPLLIAQLTGVPVFVAPRRADAALALLRAHPATDILLCDDGLQHYALQRDLNIAVFDERGVGNGWLLPAGPLREPWPQTWAASRPTLADPFMVPGEQKAASVKPVELVLHTAALIAPEGFGGFGAQRALANEAVTADGRLLDLEDLKGERLCALAGIAKPHAFFDMLRARGLQLERTLALPDHISLDELAQLGLFLGDEKGACRVLCTQKDAVKLFALYPAAGLQLLAVPLTFEPEPAFLQALDKHLAARPPTQTPAQVTASLLPSPDGYKTP